MRTVVFIVIFYSLGFQSFSQFTGVWHSFYDYKKDLHGFKNEKGKVVIPPKFTAFIIAQRFEHIMVATEDFGDSSTIYYLTKSGRKIGMDSVWMVDNTPDCESEGFIRFKNKTTNKTGMLNRHGKVVIPAEYNTLSQVQNGMIVALKDAQKKQLGSHNHEGGCDHYIWEGGTQILLDTNNNILINKFENSENLSLYNYFTSFMKYPDSSYSSYLGNANRYYHFLNYEKEFNDWLKKLLSSLSKDKLVAVSYPKLNIYSEKMIETKAKKYITKNYQWIHDHLMAIQKPGADYFINDMMGEYAFLEKYEKGVYYTNCSELNTGKYPVFMVTINKKPGNEDQQTDFIFLRATQGYKLIAIRN